MEGSRSHPLRHPRNVPLLKPLLQLQLLPPQTGSLSSQHLNIFKQHLFGSVSYFPLPLKKPVFFKVYLLWQHHV